MRSLPGLVWSTQFRARGRYTKSDGRGATPLTGLIEVADGVADVSGLGSRRSGSCDSRARALRCAREWPLCMPSPSMQSTFSLSPLSPLFFSFNFISPCMDPKLLDTAFSTLRIHRITNEKAVLFLFPLLLDLQHLQAPWLRLRVL